MSLPVPSTPKSAAIAAPVPPLDPPGVRAEVVRVPGLSAQRADGRPAQGQLGEVRLGQNKRSGLPQPPHDEGVVWRDGLGQGDRGARRRHIGGVEVVLHDHWNAVEGPAVGPVRDIEAIQLSGGVERTWVQGQNRVERRPLVVVRLDPAEVVLHQLHAGESTRGEGVVDPSDGGFFQGEGAADLTFPSNCLATTRGQAEREDEGLGCVETGDGIGQ